MLRPCNKWNGRQVVSDMPLGVGTRNADLAYRSKVRAQPPVSMMECTLVGVAGVVLVESGKGRVEKGI